MFLALSVKVVVQEHLFVDHFKGNLQLHFSLNVHSKFSISHALFINILDSHVLRYRYVFQENQVPS